MPRLAEAIVSSTVRLTLPARIRVRGISTKPLSWNTSAPSVTGWPHDLAAAQPLWHGGVLKAVALGSIAREGAPADHDPIPLPRSGHAEHAKGTITRNLVTNASLVRP